MTGNVPTSNRLMHGTRVFMLWYVGTWLVAAFALLVLLFTIDEVETGQVWRYWQFTLQQLVTQTPVYFIALVPYLFFLIARDAIRRFKSQRWGGVAHSLLRYVAAPATIFWVLLQISEAYRLSEDYAYTWDASIEHQGPQSRDLYMQDGKHRGMHVFNLRDDATDLAQLKTNNFEWITVVPYIGQEVHNKPPIRASSALASDSSSFDWITQYADLAAPYNFRLMVKPHIWLSSSQGGTWRSDIAMESEAAWDVWFTYYTRYLLALATVAEDIGADMFCIGTELHSAVMAKPDRWRALIAQIRQVYSGNLTYAANWSDDLETIPFWDALDYIGIQAYFPVAEVKHPTLAEIETGWQTQAGRLERLAHQYNKPILFTEIGYRSTASAALTPWEWTSARDFFRPISHETQALAYTAFFNVVWEQPWFAGAHLWQWSANSSKDGKNSGFSVAGKPALNVIAKGFHAPVPPQADSIHVDFGLLP